MSDPTGDFGIISGKRRNGKELVSWASQYTEEYKTTIESIVSKAPLVEGRNTWAPPLVNVFKVNVDRAIFMDQKVVALE